jgi:hypothetical protein
MKKYLLAFVFLMAFTGIGILSAQSFELPNAAWDQSYMQWKWMDHRGANLEVLSGNVFHDSQGLAWRYVKVAIWESTYGYLIGYVWTRVIADSGEIILIAREERTTARWWRWHWSEKAVRVPSADLRPAPPLPQPGPRLRDQSSGPGLSSGGGAN